MTLEAPKFWLKIVRLYNIDSNEQFKAMLNENMKPVYNSAKLQGYSLWVR